MLTKLTLTIDRDVISKAKDYADEHHVSVSKLVEFYLRSFSNKENLVEFKLPPLTSKLLGISRSNSKESDKEQLVKALKSRHML